MTTTRVRLDGIEALRAHAAVAIIFFCNESELSVSFTRRFARVAPLIYVVLGCQLINVW